MASVHYRPSLARKSWLGSKKDIVSGGKTRRATTVNLEDKCKEGKLQKLFFSPENMGARKDGGHCQFANVRELC